MSYDQQIADLENDNAALREQLAAVTKERDEARDVFVMFDAQLIKSTKALIEVGKQRDDACALAVRSKEAIDKSRAEVEAMKSGVRDGWKKSAMLACRAMDLLHECDKDEVDYDRFKEAVQSLRLAVDAFRNIEVRPLVEGGAG